MGEKFWMVKGCLGSPVAIFHSELTARNRAFEIAMESGQPSYLLEAVRVFTPDKPGITNVTEREL